jgi:hypothetical protein
MTDAPIPAMARDVIVFMMCWKRVLVSSFLRASMRRLSDRCLIANSFRVTHESTRFFNTSIIATSGLVQYV